MAEPKKQLPLRQRKKNGRYVSDQIDLPPELDIE